jgi:hypothetical protein
VELQVIGKDLYLYIIIAAMAVEITGTRQLIKILQDVAHDLGIVKITGITQNIHQFANVYALPPGSLLYPLPGTGEPHFRAGSLAQYGKSLRRSEPGRTKLDEVMTLAKYAMQPHPQGISAFHAVGKQVGTTLASCLNFPVPAAGEKRNHLNLKASAGRAA